MLQRSGHNTLCTKLPTHWSVAANCGFKKCTLGNLNHSFKKPLEIAGKGERLGNPAGVLRI